MEREEISTKVAGVDVGKARLDVAVHGLEDESCFANTTAASPT